jgi:hypothetical protein
VRALLADRAARIQLAHARRAHALRLLHGLREVVSPARASSRQATPLRPPTGRSR